MCINLSSSVRKLSTTGLVERPCRPGSCVARGGTGGEPCATPFCRRQPPTTLATEGEPGADPSPPLAASAPGTSETTLPAAPAPAVMLDPGTASMSKPPASTTFDSMPDVASSSSFSSSSATPTPTSRKGRSLNRWRRRCRLFRRGEGCGCPSPCPRASTKTAPFPFTLSLLVLAPILVVAATSQLLLKVGLLAGLFGSESDQSWIQGPPPPPPSRNRPLRRREVRLERPIALWSGKQLCREKVALGSLEGWCERAAGDTGKPVCDGGREVGEWGDRLRGSGVRES